MKNDIHRSTIKRLSKLCLAVFLLFNLTIQPVLADNHLAATLNKPATSANLPFKDAVQICQAPQSFDALPERVFAMQQDILAAAATGTIDKMQFVADQNEIWPIAEFSSKSSPHDTPLISWVAQSQQTNGVYILAQMSQILNLPFSKQKLVADIDLYVWPYFANSDISQLCPAEIVNLLKVSSVSAYKQMQKTGLYTGFQLAIGSDGSWHYFARKNLVKQAQ